ncbi:hypothetical protein QMK33_16990 [Hymenobacter sp. H14-R3]|uniref:hypothetical protein n=1 Tax=Hymenobacter sp. H14-R3 TaxID=3046308 RepID=UPI0024BA3C37|nr:hypothetical protein [Hymenobacter sp. H14-R3]MDJ0366850.1 hypothetical protein [Hymenobacter sp. H14-R3]
MRAEYMLRHWCLASTKLAASATARRLFGGYATAPGPVWYRLLLQLDQTYCLEKLLDKGLRAVPLLQGGYQLAGPHLQLHLPATQRGRAHAWCASLRLHNGPGGVLQLLPAAPAAPEVGQDQAPSHVFDRQEFPKLLRCINQQFGRYSFADSLTVGSAYVALGPATKAGFVEVLNDNQRVRQYPASAFRSEE